MRPKPRFRRNPVTGIRSWMTCLQAAGGLAILFLLGPGVAGAGAAEYEYKVTTFDYLLTANMSAERAPDGCLAGVSAGWGGTVAATSSEFQNLNLGDGFLHIGRRGSSGKVDAKGDVDYEFENGTHTIWTVCPSGMNFGTTVETGPCSTSATGELGMGGVIVGGVGDKVNILWDFRQNDTVGRWVPDSFTCVEPMLFANQDCRTKKVPLRTLTKKKFKLRFLCVANSTTPPEGTDWVNYHSFVAADGFIALQRTGQSG